mmetsp:Transcript_2904/g.6849  ORF Transcript_2904/g.6849 Transcript_2904/m.6849 type:complete len:200 (+) Transcript_2904:129-728(+)
MVKILLSCNVDTYDIATDLKADIQEQLGFKVALDVEDDSTNPEADEDDGFQQELTDAAVLLVFQFGDESISAWIMVEDTDDKSFEECKYEEMSFPEIINFSKSVQRGIRILRTIMVEDFGVIVRPIEDNTPKATSALPPADFDTDTVEKSGMYTMDQMIKDQQEYEAAKASLSLASDNKPGLIRKITKLFGKSRRRLSQ